MAARSIPDKGYLLGIDFGLARVGLALASPIAKLPRPLKIVENNPSLVESIQDIIKQEGISLIVVGLPRDQQGRQTAQTEATIKFIDTLASKVDVPVQTVDESLSSVRADAAAKDIKGREQIRHNDDLAACFILDTYLGRF